MTVIIPATPATSEEFLAAKHKTVYSMQRYGGNFIAQLAGAIAAADPNNARRLYEAVPDLIAPFAPGGRFHHAN